MKWVTRSGARVDRVACPWLIRRFIDPEAEIIFVPADRVLVVAQETGAISFDAEGARYGHRGNKCTFEVLLDEYGLVEDPALERLALMVHGADIPGDIGIVPEAAGLWAFAEGLRLMEEDDHRKLELAGPFYNALYAYCRSGLSAIERGKRSSS